MYDKIMILVIFCENDPAYLGTEILGFSELTIAWNYIIVYYRKTIMTALMIYHNNNGYNIDIYRISIIEFYNSRDY